MGDAAGRRPAIFAFPAQPCGRGRSDRAALNGKKYLKPWLQRRCQAVARSPATTSQIVTIAGYFIDKRVSDLPMHP